jgi:hypothetical protein
MAPIQEQFIKSRRIEAQRIFHETALDGTQCTYIGVLHSSDDTPTVECKNGDLFWYQDGQFHREGGPAMQYANGNQFWYHKGQIHRDNGPSYEYANGDRMYTQHGQLHREDGPAVLVGEKREYWLHGVQQSSLEKPL